MLKVHEDEELYVEEYNKSNTIEYFFRYIKNNYSDLYIDKIAIRKIKKTESYSFFLDQKKDLKPYRTICCIYQVEGNTLEQEITIKGPGKEEEEPTIFSEMFKSLYEALKKKDFIAMKDILKEYNKKGKENNE